MNYTIKLKKTEDIALSYASASPQLDENGQLTNVTGQRNQNK